MIHPQGGLGWVSGLTSALGPEPAAASAPAAALEGVPLLQLPPEETPLLYPGAGGCRHEGTPDKRGHPGKGCFVQQFLLFCY